jgi:hypothetical protein
MHLQTYFFPLLLLISKLMENLLSGFFVWKLAVALWNIASIITLFDSAKKKGLCSCFFLKKGLRWQDAIKAVVVDHACI